MSAPCNALPTGRRHVWLIARDEDGFELDRLEVTGDNAGVNGTQSGVEMGDGELKEMWHAKRSREEVSLVGVPGATPGVDQVEVRRWTMRLITMQTDHRTWDQVERRLWTLTTPDRIGGRTGLFAVRFQERSGQAREITVRRTGTPEPESTTYAGQRGYEAWSFEVTAYDPWWYGEPVRDAAEGVSGDFTLRVRNLGDQYGFLKWTMPAADGDATWTIPDGEGVYPRGHDRAGERIRHELPTVEEGDVAESHQRPDRLPFRILGAPMSFGLMKQSRFTNPIMPRHGVVELPVSVDTEATDAAIEVELTPAFERPHS